MFSSEILPKRRDPSGPFTWAAMRPKLFEGYFNCLPALAQAGNNLVLDYVMETQGQLDQLLRLLKPFDVFYVGVHCPLAELERREKLRGDRKTGDARRDFETVHTFSDYDLEVDSTEPVEQNATTVIAAWKARQKPSVFERLASSL